MLNCDCHVYLSEMKTRLFQSTTVPLATSSSLTSTNADRFVCCSAGVVSDSDEKTNTETRGRTPSKQNDFKRHNSPMQNTLSKQRCSTNSNRVDLSVCEAALLPDPVVCYSPASCRLQLFRPLRRNSFKLQWIMRPWLVRTGTESQAHESQIKMIKFVIPVKRRVVSRAEGNNT